LTMISEDLLIKRAEEARIRDHRLTPSLKLRTREEIIEFIHGKGLVSVLGGNELPSLISAVLGKPWKPSSKGFSGWLEWWSFKIENQRLPNLLGEIERRKDILATRVFRRTKTLVSKSLWPILGVIVEHHRELATKRMILSDLELKLLKTIKVEGSIRTDRLRKLVRMEARGENARFHRALASLESYALTVGVEDPKPEKHLHANIWQTWKTRTGDGNARLSYRGALAKLVEKTVDASVLVREDQFGKWFRWSTDTGSVKDELLRDGTMLKAGKFIVSPRVIRAKAKGPSG
jgi:hypothetical protein